ncbi:hypothetical protein YK56LOC_42530 [Caballeronia sp. HLA56]
MDPGLKVGDQIGNAWTFDMPDWAGKQGMEQYAVALCDIGTLERFVGTTPFDPATDTYLLPNVEGVGYQVYYPANPNSGNQVPRQGLAPIVIPNPHRPGYMVYPPASQGRPLTLRFIKTGVIKGGYASVRKYATGELIYPTVLETLSLSFGVIVQQPTCDIRSKYTNVEMPKTDASDFSGVGSTSAKKSLFEIKMDCNQIVSNLKIKFESPYGNTDMPGTIRLIDQGSRTARDVGIRMRYGRDNQVVYLNQQLDISDFLQDPSHGVGEVSLPMSAEYVQTGTDVKPGAANSVALFTIEFQ